jgi:putative transposase
MVNLREGWRGHFWPFASFVLDKPYLLTAARYVELNPVRAGLASAPTRYRWSSAAAHARGRDDALVRVAPLLKLAPPWRGFLARVIREEHLNFLRAHEHTGRPLGDEEFLTTVEQTLGRILKPQKPGPKPKRPRISKRHKEQRRALDLGSLCPHTAVANPGNTNPTTSQVAAPLAPRSIERTR